MQCAKTMCQNHALLFAVDLYKCTHVQVRTARSVYFITRQMQVYVFCIHAALKQINIIRAVDIIKTRTYFQATHANICLHIDVPVHELNSVSALGLPEQMCGVGSVLNSLEDNESRRLVLEIRDCVVCNTRNKAESSLRSDQKMLDDLSGLAEVNQRVDSAQRFVRMGVHACERQKMPPAQGAATAGCVYVCKFTL
jgi:hypothetical protein